ncbi:MAG TPA: trypsin-like peptidase domain-containing protein [Mycobacteriales bacterium]|nr:trypsin-like peptidase domain-containing protein [Mycobacteriales bacterium]
MHATPDPWATDPWQPEPSTTTPVARPDPWTPPPTRAHAWGYPTGPIGPVQSSPPPALPRFWALLSLVLATALLAGSIGGVVGYRWARDDAPTTAGLRDPSATLGAPVPAVRVNRPAASVAGIAARVLRSVVSIAVVDGTGSGTGSGVVLRSDGYLLTNNHVVASAADGGTITVSFNDGSVDLPARIVGRDPETDLAVLRVIGARHLTPATLGSSSDLAVGDPVVAVGSPLGLAGTVTSGIISALDRTVRVPGEGGAAGTPLFDAIQTDAAINPGNSGGPLVDVAGRVIGINSAIASLSSGGTEDQAGSIGVGFAIPVDEARSIAEQLIRTGKATHPVIGVQAKTVGSDGNGPRGAQVSSLVSGGAAKESGVRVGDIITAVDGRAVTSVDQLVVVLRTHRVGERVTLALVRNGARLRLQCVLQDKPSPS